MRPELVTITPELAERLLLGNTHNRPLSASTVTYFVRALRSGRFVLTHQGIALTGPTITEPGDVLDGQHRLEAVRVTGIAVQMWITFDAPPETFNAIDRGKVRSIPDLLSIRGYKNAKALTSAWQYAYCWERGNVAFTATRRDDGLASLLERWPPLRDLAVVKATEVAQQGMLTFVAFIVDDDEFVGDLLTQTSSTPGGNVGAVLAERHRKRLRLDRRYDLAIVVKARNDHAAGTLARSRYNYRQAEAFPLPQWTAPIPFDSVESTDDDEDA